MLASSHPQAVTTAAIVASHATRSIADASDNSIPIANGTSANGLSGCGNGTYSTSCCASLSMLVSPAKSPVRIWPENLAGFRICAGCADVGTVNHLDYLCIYRRSGEVSSGSALLPSRQSTLARAGAATNGLLARGPCQFRRCKSSRGTSTPICCRFSEWKAAGDQTRCGRIRNRPRDACRPARESPAFGGALPCPADQRLRFGELEALACRFEAVRPRLDLNLAGLPFSAADD